MATKPLVSDYLVPPGHYLREALEFHGLSQVELAERMGRPAQVVNEIVNGKKEVTEETAFELESVLGTPAHVWLNLEGIYRYGKQTIERERHLLSQEEEARKFPYNELCKLGHVPETRDWRERVVNLMRFFGLARLNLVSSNYAAAFRKAEKKEPSPHALAAWLRVGEREAEKLDLPPFDRSALRKAIPELRRATRTCGEIDGVLREILGPAGVAFVSAPHLAKTYANGAAYWHGNKAILLLSIRGLYSDIIWFSLFHEVGHLLLHDKASTFIEGLGLSSKEEDEANSWASDTLIPSAVWDDFFVSGDFGHDAVVYFANELEICPSIVVGRLMRETQDYSGFPSLRALRGRMSWS